MDIGLCADNNFVVPLGICILSVLETNRSHEICFHVISSGISDTNKGIISDVVLKYNKKVAFYDIDGDTFKEYPVNDRFPNSIYYRFLLSELLPDNVERILYLDCDTIVNGDISELFATDLGDTFCGVVPSQSCDDIRHKNRLGIGYRYFNSGVLLFEISVWRQNDIVAKSMQFLGNENYMPVCPDQDALNVVFDNNVTWLPWKYNFQEDLLMPHSNSFIDRKEWDIIDQNIHDMRILHYCGNFKPWHKECLNPLCYKWLELFGISPWRNTKFHYKNSLKERIRHRIARDLYFHVNPLYIDLINKKSI
ncbi:MAG: glycosyltransferase family 8 protein [Bacteroidales bacterium]|nr:glycosyltransferase family 8 protein [Bacteroidales bacterium]MCM1147027.1 glycosyltransferase family 8 protein [Bacteroidales bacterium]MCM1205840.1 glycosyltransferase family 8 protein [Bacillota bacterium]MCM1509918.1 glycosyltransferase family 8 protein [Clostridium sp.]